MTTDSGNKIPVDAVKHGRRLLDRRRGNPYHLDDLVNEDTTKIFSSLDDNDPFFARPLRSWQPEAFSHVEYRNYDAAQ